ncbi:MAG: hypothetical protein H0X37_11365 [Herpetosiphonaceae bacterium]|nr:hypothetical protein [Herpetosiphonaceae bacterium]
MAHRIGIAQWIIEQVAVAVERLGIGRSHQTLSLAPLLAAQLKRRLAHIVMHDDKLFSYIQQYR